MTLTSRPISITPVLAPLSDIDFGAKIENVDLEHLSGK